MLFVDVNQAITLTMELMQMVIFIKSNLHRFFMKICNSIDKICKPKSCSFPTLNKCQQQCHDRDNANEDLTYRCDCYSNYKIHDKFKCQWQHQIPQCKYDDIPNAYCNSDGIPLCRLGMEWNNKTKTCDAHDDNTLIGKLNFYL